MPSKSCDKKVYVCTVCIIYMYVCVQINTNFMLCSKGMLLSDCPDLTPGNGDRYVRLYRAIAEKTALLVSEWMRVGYVQG